MLQETMDTAVEIEWKNGKPMDSVTYVVGNMRDMW